MAKKTAWDAQTKWLSDQTFYSELPGIWRDKVTRRDRRCQVQDSDVLKLRHLRPGRMDGFGNLPPRDSAEQAKLLIERVINNLQPDRRQAVTPRAKWSAVELLVAGDAKGAMALL